MDHTIKPTYDTLGNAQVDLEYNNIEMLPDYDKKGDPIKQYADLMQKVTNLKEYLDTLQDVAKLVQDIFLAHGITEKEYRDTMEAVYSSLYGITYAQAGKPGYPRIIQTLYPVEDLPVYTKELLQMKQEVLQLGVAHVREALSSTKEPGEGAPNNAI